MRPSCLLILLGIIEISISANTTCDPAKEFDCGTGICLPKAWQCDHIKDCHNGADEIGCEPNECPEGDIICLKCRKSQYKCDGFPDCYDGSDEKYCEYNSRRFNPVFGNRSLYAENGGFDNDGCVPGFGYCSTHDVCIPNRSFCDGKSNCYESEDELFCSRDNNSENPCKDKFVCKTNETYKNEVCIQMDELCNGRKDCPLGDDESEKCSECSSKHCEYQCKNTPTGAKCECRKGYRLNSDGVTCMDINECALPDRVCHHFCENKNGSFLCSCAKGFHLDADGKTCELTKPRKGYLLLSFHNEIEERPLEDFSRANFTSIYKANGNIRAFDYFHNDHKLFMITGRKLVVKEDGKPSKTLLENVDHLLNLAVDWIGGNIFFSQIVPGEYDVVRISVCTMDGKFCRGIIEARDNRHSNFVIHPMRGLVFYTERKKNATQIMMANMDGSQAQVLIETNSRTTLTLAIDNLNDDLYFGDTSQANIQRVNIDTKKSTIIASRSSFKMLDSFIYHNGFIYFTEGYSPHITVLDVTRKNARAHIVSHMDKIVRNRMGSPPLVVVNDSIRQLEPFPNPCQELDCSWICVMLPGFTAKCLCPDGYVASLLGTSCIPLGTEKQDKLKLPHKSYIGLELMSEYCKTGVGCLNGGSCRKVSNKIVCDCLESFDGLYCERRKPILSDETILIIILVIVLLLLLIAIGSGVYWFFFVYRRNKGISDMIPLVSKSSNGRFEETSFSL